MYILKESKYTHKLRLLMIIARKYECEWKWEYNYFNEYYQ